LLEWKLAKEEVEGEDGSGGDDEMGV